MTIFEGIMLMFGFLVGFAFGWIIKDIIIAYQKVKFMRHVGETAKKVIDEIEKNTIFVSVEKHSEHYFFYNNETNVFLCKGETVEELADAFRSRFPEKNAVIVAGEEQIVRHLEEQFAEYFGAQS